MSKDLRRSLFVVLESSSVDELTALLQPLCLISLHLKTCEDGPDFSRPRPASSLKQSPTIRRFPWPNGTGWSGAASPDSVPAVCSGIRLTKGRPNIQVEKQWESPPRPIVIVGLGWREWPLIRSLRGLTKATISRQNERANHSLEVSGNAACREGGKLKLPGQNARDPNLKKNPYDRTTKTFHVRGGGTCVQ
jgi:hypothetical protein